MRRIHARRGFSFWAKMAHTEAQLTALDAAIASGVLTVRYGDTSTTYRTMDELLQARARVYKDLQDQAGVRIIRQRKVYATKGL